MKENGIPIWTGIGSWGMLYVPFDNPFALTTVDDLILEDAKRNKYKAVIQYNCLIPYFNHEVAVN